MRLTNLIKKKFTDNGSESDAIAAADIDAALDAIVRVEKKREAAKPALEAARRAVSRQQALDLDGDASADIDAAVATVVAETARFDGMERLLLDAKNRAMGMIAAGKAERRQRLTECEAEIADCRRAIATRSIRSIAEFAKKHGLRVSWPTKHNGGVIHLPAMVVEGDELLPIADSVKAAEIVDPDSGRLADLLAERLRINVEIGSTPDLALEVLLGERRRK